MPLRDGAGEDEGEDEDDDGGVGFFGLLNRENIGRAGMAGLGTTLIESS